MARIDTLLTPPAALRDLGLLLARIAIGAVLIAHGWQKLVTNGLDATTQGFSAMGVPAASASATMAALIELGGGILLLFGLLTPVAGILVVLQMIGAWWFGHRGNGFFAAEGGGELVLMIGALALSLAATGPGRYALDALLARRNSGRATSVKRDRERVGADA
ncbi:MAG: DoxX family protein [Micrococcales bacterium]|nr:DoxX family protein [Micrococcales bacterium]